MPANTAMSEKRKALLAYKDKILKELDYYDSRIEEITTTRSKTSFIEEDDSSDSEPEFHLSLDLGPSIAQLRQQQKSLKTCLLATQELTNLQVLESQVNVLVEEPVVVGETPVREKGVWREVTAECKADLVAFSISFYVHQSDRQFGPRSYRCVRVALVRAAHANELEPSILGTVSTPSDAVEVVKSYAAAHRSRRTTLARLATKYADTLHMEPMPEGGYLLKCANLLEVSWVLQNKWSPIAPFHHRMKFNLEYMDESYIKIITQAHRQLSDPSIETDERTFLLSKIISTCLEAQGPTQELYESMSSDPETAQSLRKRRTTLDQEPEQPSPAKNKDREVMAPPKSLPKKAKPKGKENIAENIKAKKDNDTNKAKTVKDNERTDLKSGKTSVSANEVNNVDSNNVKEKVNKKLSPKEITSNSNTNVASTRTVDTAKSAEKKVEKDNTNVNKAKKTNEKLDSETNADKKVANKKPNIDTIEKSKEKVKKNVTSAKKDAVKPKDTVSAKKGDAITSETSKEPTKQATNNENKQTNKIIKDRATKENVNKTVKNKVVKSKPIQEVVSNDNREKNKDRNEAVTDNLDKAVKNKENKIASKDKVKPTTSKTDVVSSNKDLNNKVTNDKPKTVASINNKKTTNAEQTKINVNKQDMKAKPVIAKPVKKKIVVDKENNQNVKDKETTESTIEKVVEKRKSSTSLKRKSNLADKLDADTDTQVAIKKPKLSKPETAKNVVNNKIDKKVANTNKAKLSKPVPSQNVVNNKINKKDGTNVAIVKKPKLSKLEASQNAMNSKINKDGDAKISKPESSNIMNKKVEKINEINKENKVNKPPGKIVKKIDQNKPKISVSSIKTLKTGNIQRVFNSGNISKVSSEKVSKIPQKKLSSGSDTLKKNPLRISPRKIPSKFKTPSTFGNKYTVVSNKITSIPRLMKRPSPKT